MILHVYFPNYLATHQSLHEKDTLLPSRNTRYDPSCMYSLSIFLMCCITALLILLLQDIVNMSCSDLKPLNLCRHQVTCEDLCCYYGCHLRKPQVDNVKTGRRQKNSCKRASSPEFDCKIQFQDDNCCERKESRNDFKCCKKAYTFHRYY